MLLQQITQHRTSRNLQITPQKNEELLTTPRCQMNESTRLSFLDFSPPCIWTCHVLFPTLLVYLALLILLFHPTPSFVPIFYEIYVEYPPYSFIWPYLFNWHRRVTLSSEIRILSWYFTLNIWSYMLSFSSSVQLFFIIGHYHNLCSFSASMQYNILRILIK